MRAVEARGTKNRCKIAAPGPVVRGSGIAEGPAPPIEGVGACRVGHGGHGVSGEGLVSGAEVLRAAVGRHSERSELLSCSVCDLSQCEPWNEAAVLLVMLCVEIACW